MRKIAALFIAATVIGLGAACTTPDAAPTVSTAPTAHSKHASADDFVTQALPVLTDITERSTNLANNPLDKSEGRALGVDATNGLSLTATSGDKGIDAAWTKAMLSTRKIANDVKAQDLTAISRDAVTGANDLTAFNNAIDAWTAKQR